jgi:hypothetical protein
MRILLALALASAGGTPAVGKLVLKPAQVGAGYVRVAQPDGVGTAGVTLNLCGRAGYPSERLRSSRLQLNYLKKQSPIGISNEVVVYQPGGAAQAMREVAQHADNCPNKPIDSGEPGLPKLLFTITRIHDAKLLKGYVAVQVRVRGTVRGKKIDQTSFAVYQRLGSVLSGMYTLSVGSNTPQQRKLVLHAAEQSAKNLLHGSNAGSPVA